MKRFVRGLLFVLFISAILSGGWFFVYGSGDGRVYQEVVEDRPDYLRPEIVDVSALILQKKYDSEESLILSCAGDSCHPNDIPYSVQAESVSDGKSWFRYIEVEDSKLAGGKKVLQRMWNDSDRTQTIVEQTPLIKPRDLIISPDSKKLAYWMDNTDKGNNFLTELWVYNEEHEGTNLILADVNRLDVLTNPRWNKSGTHLWFLADSAPDGEPDKVEFIVAGINPISAQARFLNIDWNKFRDKVSSGIMDVNLNGDALAYTEPAGKQRTTLVIYDKDNNEQSITVRGEVAHLQWLEDDRLLYAVQDDKGFTFWHLQGGTHRHVTRHNGTLRSVHGDVRGEYLAFITQLNDRSAKMFVLHIDSGLSREQLDVPMLGENTKLVYVEQGEVLSRGSSVAGVTSGLDDGQLIAFIESNLEAITGKNTVTATRIVIANDVNTVYVDYGPTGGPLADRVLLTIRDAIHTEWSVRGRFEATGPHWRKTQGGGLKDPEPLRMYEWEDVVGRWILKQEF